ncbi:MAG: tyrosine-type recombinase/integrase [Candidatus Aenigmarchaeota archaeon]|nr:tyrosine-type recombinase/integrase [Candidatus Aenigmarchaeota archaeon]
MDSFYRSNKDYERVLCQIRVMPEISPNNAETLAAFAQRLRAEGISLGRIKKYLILLRDLTIAMKKDYADLDNRDIEAALAQITARGLAAWTMNDYKIAVKRLLKFVLGDSFNPEKYRWIKTKRNGPRKFDITYNDLLTKDEVEQLVNAVHSPMYKCLFALAYETAARPSELLTLTVGSLKSTEGYTRIFLRESKTFTRTIFAMDSDRYLRAWLNVHPLRRDQNAPLFPSSYVSYLTKQFLQPEGFNVTLKRTAKKLGMEKRVYSYLLRHSRITHLLEAGWNEIMIKKLVGHSVESKAFRFYEHLAEKQVEEYVLKQHSIEQREKRALGVVSTTVCTFCKTENSLSADFCVQCSRAISVKGLFELEDREQQVLKLLTPEMIDKMIEVRVEEILKTKLLKA